MPSFRGTFDEFYQWADPRTRIWITQKTKKKRRGVQTKDGCARCKRQDVSLTAAHLTPRKDVVRAALGIKDNAKEVELDLADAWEKIKRAHRPFEERFRYLCAECHRAVDAEAASAAAATSSPP